MIGPTVKEYLAADLWSSQDELEKRCYKSLQATLAGYGLELDNFNSIWAATDQAKNEIRQRRLEHDARIKELQARIAKADEAKRKMAAELGLELDDESTGNADADATGSDDASLASDSVHFSGLISNFPKFFFS